MKPLERFHAIGAKYKNFKPIIGTKNIMTYAPWSFTYYF
jgi:hypothetical protein